MPSLPSKGCLDMISFTCRKWLFADCLACAGQTLTLAVPQTQAPTLTCNFQGADTGLAGRDRRAADEPRNRPLSQKGEGAGNLAFTSPEPEKPQMGALKDWSPSPIA